MEIKKLAKIALYKLQAQYMQSRAYLDFGPLPSFEHDLNSIIPCQGWSHY